MLAGSLRHRIKVYKRRSIVTPTGAEELQWAPAFETWAQAVGRSASMREELNARFESTTISINVRMEHDIRVEDRISFNADPGYTYVVVERNPNFNRDMVTYTLAQIQE